MWRHSRRNAGYREIRSLEILSVKKEAKLSASEVTELLTMLPSLHLISSKERE